MKLQRIVIGVDFSETAIAAVQWVARYLAPDAELVLVHSVFVPQPPRLLRGWFPPAQRVIETARAGAEQRLEELARRVGRAHLEVRVGQPAEELVRCAIETGADLIVVGRHGERPGVWDWLGSTAEQVLERSPVPVLLASGMRDARPRRVLVALDDGEITPAVMQWTRDLGERYDARVRALHVLRAVPTPAAVVASAPVIGTGDSLLDPALVDAEIRWETDRWRDRLLDAGFDLDRFRTDVVIGEPEYEIVRAAEHQGVELIVIGNRRSGGITRSLLGSVVRGVLRRAPCPTLVITETREELDGA